MEMSAEGKGFVMHERLVVEGLLSNLVFARKSC